MDVMALRELETNLSRSERRNVERPTAEILL